MSCALDAVVERALLADEETFRTMVKIGLSNTGELQMPPNLAFSLFKRFEAILPPKEAGVRRKKPSSPWPANWPCSC